MALITCPECQASISEKALMCPQCGMPRDSMNEVVRVARLACWGYEWKSRGALAGWPLVHIAIGRNRQTGKLLVAKGIIAIGQFAIGVVTIAQFGLGLLFGFGQFVTGLLVIGQFAVGGVAIGQFAVGVYVLAQWGYGFFVWSVFRKDLQAVACFQQLWRWFCGG